MLAFSILLYTTLANAAAVPLAFVTTSASIINSPLNPRSQKCANSPGTVAGTTSPPEAGTPFDRRDVLTLRTPPNNLAPLPISGSGIPWCAPNTRTYVIMRVGWRAANTINLFSMLLTVWDETNKQIAKSGDRVMVMSAAALQDGVTWLVNNAGGAGAPGLKVTLRNANNHQITWGVWRAALTAVYDFVKVNGGFVDATFDVFDGDNKVADGHIM